MDQLVSFVKQSFFLLKERPFLLVGTAAFMLWVPFIVVGFPICVVTFVVCLGTAVVNKQAVGLVMIPFIPVAMALFAGAYNAVRVGWTHMILKLSRDEEISFRSDLKEGFQGWFMPFLLTNLAIGMVTGGAPLLAAGLGALLGGFWILALPVLVASMIFSVLFVARTCLAPFVVISEDLGPVDALKRSNELTSGYTLQVLGLYAAFFLVNSVTGVIPVVNFLMPPALFALFDIVLVQVYEARAEAEAEAEAEAAER